jgi:hypothetical protein
MIYSHRLVCIAFVLSLATLSFKDCGSSNQSANKNQNTSTANTSVSPIRPDNQPASQIIYGITIEDTNKPQKIVDTIKRIKKETGREVMTRILVDPQREITDKYVERFAKVRAVGPVMVLVADSHDMYRFNDDDGTLYEQRINECYTKLGRYVDIWEIGNEVNGEWTDYSRLENEEDADFDKRLEAELKTGDPEKFKKIRDMVGKQIARAFHVINDKGGKTALTFYYNEHLGRTCLQDEVSFGQEYGMFRWIDQHVTDQKMRDNLDYVFISFYEDDCKISTGKKNEDIIADAKGYIETFDRLSKIFKKAGVGFGEFGPQCYYEGGRGSKACIVDQAEFIDRYYKKYNGLITTPKYVGGYFYWYGLQDMISSNRPAVTDLIKAIPKT